MCETNVTESESLNFYIPGYNKFVLDKVKKTDKLFKQKGSGIVIFLSEKFVNVKIRTDLSLSTIDFEVLSIEVNIKVEKLILVCCYITDLQVEISINLSNISTIY